MKNFIFSEIQCFQPEGLYFSQRFCLDFKWLHLSFSIQLQILLIQKHPLEILVKSWKISFLQLTNMNTSNYHLPKMNCIRGFSRALPKFYTTHYKLFEFSEYLFQETPNDGCKVDALFIKQPRSVFLGMFLFKELPQKKHTFILTSMKRGNSIIAFHHVFIITFYAVSLQ